MWYPIPMVTTKKISIEYTHKEMRRESNMSLQKKKQLNTNKSNNG